MNKIKVKNIKTGTVKEINESLVKDYVGTGDFEIYKEEIIKSTVETVKITMGKKHNKRK